MCCALLRCPHPPCSAVPAGYGYFRKHVRLFDPSFGGKEFWEGDTMDNGNDPLGLATRHAL